MAEQQNKSDNRKQESQQTKGTGAGGGEDLKEREYRDKEGNVHHHTKEYMERSQDRGGER
jgi:hypothetical protein